MTTLMKTVSTITNILLTGLATYSAVKTGDPFSYAVMAMWALATICSAIAMKD